MTNPGGKYKDLNMEHLHNRYHVLVNECRELKCFSMNSLIYNTVAQFGWKQQDEHDSIEFQKLSLENYKEVFKLLLECEFAHMQMELCRYDVQAGEVIQVKNKTKGVVNSVTVPGIRQNESPVLPGDFVIASCPPYVPGADNRGRKIYIGIIVALKYKSILFNWAQICKNGPTTFKCSNLAIPEGIYEIRFALNNLWLNRLLRAVNGLPHYRRFALLDKDINNEQQKGATLAATIKIDVKLSIEAPLLNTKLKNIMEKLDCEQKLAVEKILAGRYRPRPYILFGPPGTGKTRVLVDTIVQAYCRNPKVEILVTAGSNTCADRLIIELDEYKMIDSLIRICSGANYQPSRVLNKYYSRDCTSKARVVVTTNSMCHQLLDRQFDYVFLDEAGHSMEPELLGPINRCKKDGCIVMAGDKHQLGPVVKFKLDNIMDKPDTSEMTVRARQMIEKNKKYHDLETSLLDRLHKLKTYRLKDVEIKKPRYDSEFITKLTKCYRCDPRILNVVNRDYYENKLEGLNETPQLLLDQMGAGKPNLFYDVRGPENFGQNSFSKWNVFEADVCVDLVMKLYGFGYKPKQIGIITPYKAQKNLIARCLEKKIKETKKNLDNNQTQKYLDESMCKIDTSDGFQGDEREIILISLVRSPARHNFKLALEFIEDKRRFVVTLTRAKWMNIIVGNGSLLKESPMWGPQIKISEVRQVPKSAMF